MIPSGSRSCEFEFRSGCQNDIRVLGLQFCILAPFSFALTASAITKLPQAFVLFSSSWLT